MTMNLGMSHRFWSLDKRNMIINRDLVFDEDNMLRGVKYLSTSNTSDDNVSEQVEYELDNSKEVEKLVEQPYKSSLTTLFVNEGHQYHIKSHFVA